MLTVAGLVILAIASASILATLVSRWSKEKAQIKRITGTSISIVLVLFAFSFLSSVFEAKLPLHIKPECQQNAS